MGWALTEFSLSLDLGFRMFVDDLGLSAFSEALDLSALAEGLGLRTLPMFPSSRPQATASRPTRDFFLLTRTISSRSGSSVWST